MGLILSHEVARILGVTPQRVRQLAREQMRLVHLYRNALTELERNRRVVVREVELVHGVEVRRF